MNVLIIDNEPESVLSLTDNLNQIIAVGHIKSACSTIEAVKILVNYRADVVLLNIEMPSGSGFRFFRSYKSDRL